MVTLVVGHLRCTGHHIATETLRAVLSAGNRIACRKTMARTVARGLTAAPVGKRAHVPIRAQVSIATLIGPDFGTKGSLDGEGAGKTARSYTGRRRGA